MNAMIESWQLSRKRSMTIKLITSILSLLCLVVVAESSFANDKSTRSASSSMSKDLNQIKSANRFDDSVIGEAIDQSPNYKAFSRLVKSDVPLKKLEELLATATPAGKLYLAVILWEKDFARGKNAYKTLLNDNTDVEYRSGCKVITFKVSEIAKSFLETNKFLNFETSKFCKKPIGK